MGVVTKKIVVSNEKLNRNGYRVIQEGVALDNYLKNPIVLYNHRMDYAIGTAINPRHENGDLVIDGIDFDDFPETHPLHQVQEQFKKGTLNAVSLGHLPKKTSSEKKYLAEGQKRPTVLETEVIEISVVTIPANADAVALKKTENGKFEILEGDLLNESLPLVENNTTQTPTQDMELKNIALALLLSETASESEIIAEGKRLIKANKESEKMVLGVGETLGVFKDNPNFKTRIERLAKTDTEMALGMIQDFAKQAKTESAKTQTEETKTEAPRPTEFIKSFQEMGGQTQTETVKKDWGWYMENNEQALVEMESENPKEYIRLYKEKYGVKPNMS